MSRYNFKVTSEAMSQQEMICCNKEEVGLKIRSEDCRDISQLCHDRIREELNDKCSDKEVNVVTQWESEDKNFVATFYNYVVT